MNSKMLARNVKVYRELKTDTEKAAWLKNHATLISAEDRELMVRELKRQNLTRV